MRKWLAAVLLGSTVLTSGCMGGQQQPAKAPEPSSEDVQKAVKSTLHEEDMKDFIRTEVRNQAGTELLEMALDTSEGQKVLSDSVKRTLGSSTGQTAITNQVGNMMSDPTFKTQIRLAIREALMEMMAKGVQTPKSTSGGGGGGGQSGGGGGGGQSGGQEGGGGSGGSGGGQ